MAPVGNGTVQKSSSSSVMSSFMCCTSERSGKTFQRSSYREQSKYLWLDPTRWVEKKAVKREKVGGQLDQTQKQRLILLRPILSVALICT